MAIYNRAHLCSQILMPHKIEDKSCCLWKMFWFYFQTIQAVCPDVVMVELCRGRISIIQYDEETLLKEAKDISIAKLKMAIKEVKTN